MTKENAFRLAKPKKKGLLSLVFSRFLIIALLLVWQLSLLVGFYGWLNDYFTYFSAFVGLFSLVMVI